MTKPTIHDPVTYHRAYHLGGEGRTKAPNGYVCYALPGAPDNAAGFHPGYGATEKEALLNACYWANQDAWVRVVPASQAPRWALEQAEMFVDYRAKG